MAAGAWRLFRVGDEGGWRWADSWAGGSRALGWNRKVGPLAGSWGWGEEPLEVIGVRGKGTLWSGRARGRGRGMAGGEAERECCSRLRGAG